MTAVSQHDADVLAQTIRALAPLEASDLASLCSLMQPRELKPGQHLLRAGEHAHESAIVVRGLVREYFVMASGAERTKAFGIEGQPTGSLADLLSSAPSRAFIVAEEQTRVLVAAFADMQLLAERSPSFRRYGERLTQHLLLVKAEREYELLGLDAEARYRAFVARFPGLEARIAARHIASYIGITPIHLSRLRRRRREEAAMRTRQGRAEVLPRSRAARSPRR